MTTSRPPRSYPPTTHTILEDTTNINNTHQHQLITELNHDQTQKTNTNITTQHILINKHLGYIQKKNNIINTFITKLNTIKTPLIPSPNKPKYNTMNRPHLSINYHKLKTFSILISKITLKTTSYPINHTT